MASREGGGGGALGWTILGFLAGVAATLALQTLVGGSHERELAPQAAALPHMTTTVQGDLIAAQSSGHPAKVASTQAPAATSASPAATQAGDEVADDAAAAGMTSRVPPQGDESAPRN